MEIAKEQPKKYSDESLKLAIAVALVRSKLLQKSPAPPSSSTAAASFSAPPPYSDDALKWKRKAKERKQEILRLKEDLKVAEDGLQYDLFPQSASCKCYFFDKLGLLSPKRTGDCSDQRFSDVLRRRFLRQVRIKEKRRRRTDDSLLHYISGHCNENNVEQLSASVDFLVELCDTVTLQSLEDGNFKNWCHQAADFVLGTLATMSSTERNVAPVEGIINSLIMRLLRRMCSTLQGDESHHFDTAAQCYIQHLMRKVGNEAYVGQRLIFAVSQRISLVAEGLLFTDPFDDAFPSMHYSMYMMIQLIEFLVSDYLPTWSNTGDLETSLFEEWVASILHGRKALELLENRNSLYVQYIDRVIGVVAKQAGQLSFSQKINPEILENLLS